MQNKNKKSSVCGKWFAYPVADETVDLAALAHHMEEHNTGFSEAMCLGMMTGMVKCIKEMLLQGKIAAQPLRPLAAVEAATLAVAHLQEAVLPALGRRKAATSRSTSSKGISF